ncbi:putative LRR receptor-like serine/threonine-protein kinase [Hibiscus syriacus]|uniref:LRR receptor-like serine/threonine-protein kinase n=1 Tax=Hibiscus syriacus TaxID=106335 RepID=A0A6A2WB85_HIBSY|nr:putative LRR receptor-like serine/threonine-protein kinase [Hibiscus syriacus]
MPAITAVMAGSFPNQYPIFPSISPENGKRICLRKPNTGSTSPRRLCCRSQLQEFASLTSATYGILLFSGGVFAFTKSGSKGSLFGGLTGAALMTSAKVFFGLTVGDMLLFPALGC